MKTVLISSVGGSADPVVHAVRQNAPLDFVYFLCSSGTSDTASEHTIAHVTYRKLRGDCPNCKKKFETQVEVRPIAEQASLTQERFEVIAAADPDDLADVHRACQEIVQRLHARFPGGEVSVLANYTGGTKTMSVGLAVAALRNGWRLQTNHTGAGRTNLISVQSGDIALPQDSAGILAEDRLERAASLEARHDYSGALQLLEETLVRAVIPHDLRDRVLAKRAHCQMWSAWDRLDYDNALSIAQGHSALQDFVARLKELRRIRDLTEGADHWVPPSLTGMALVEDVIANAGRCRERGRFDDAAARLYRATELLAQVRLRRKFGIRTSDVPQDRPEYTPSTRELLAANKNERTGRIELGLRAAYQFLAVLADPLGQKFIQTEESVHAFLAARNHSVLAHGLRPLSIDDAATLAEWETWLKDMAAVGAAT